MQQGAISTLEKSDVGLIFRGFNKTVEDVPTGTRMELIIAVNPDYWSNPDAFPCGPSMYVPNTHVCDYQLAGLQVNGEGGMGRGKGEGWGAGAACLLHEAASRAGARWGNAMSLRPARIQGQQECVAASLCLPKGSSPQAMGMGKTSNICRTILPSPLSF